LRFNAPHRLPSGEVHGPNTSRLLRQQIRHAEVGVLTVDGAAPLAAEAAALTDPVFPHLVTLTVWIEGVGHSRLLREDEQVATVHGGQARRSGEVEVRT